MAQLNTLTANIQREWLARILDGSKRIEHRDATDYWVSRVERVGPPPFRLRLINGMRPDSPEATLLVDRVDLDIPAGQIRLHLREVLETLRWDPAWHARYPPLPAERPFDPSALSTETLVEIPLRLEVAPPLLEALRPGTPVTFTQTLSDEAFEQLTQCPEGTPLVWLAADDEARQVALIGATAPLFGDTVDCTVVALPEGA
ncbi:MAG: hypothetical protein HY321_05390 [Armatimonadetes bacterium]|nr:hypothetical protein [Armatimonadota bacterium]